MKKTTTLTKATPPATPPAIAPTFGPFEGGGGGLGSARQTMCAHLVQSGGTRVQSCPSGQGVTHDGASGGHCTHRLKSTRRPCSTAEMALELAASDVCIPQVVASVALGPAVEGRSPTLGASVARPNAHLLPCLSLQRCCCPEHSSQAALDRCRGVQTTRLSSLGNALHLVLDGMCQPIRRPLISAKGMNRETSDWKKCSTL